MLHDLVSIAVHVVKLGDTSAQHFDLPQYKTGPRSEFHRESRGWRIGSSSSHGETPGQQDRYDSTAHAFPGSSVVDRHHAI